MPKCTLEFDMTEDRMEMEDALQGWRYSVALNNIKNFVRTKWKHEEMTDEAYKQVEEIYEFINDEIYSAHADE